MTVKHIKTTTTEFGCVVLSAFLEALHALLKKKQNVVIAIPGGRSVMPFFSSLNSAQVPWERVHIFWADERLVGAKDVENNAHSAFELFLNSLLAKQKIDSSRIHRFLVDAKKKDYGIDNYNNTLKSVGGTIDLAILGVGEDGHIASLFPDHTALGDKTCGFVLVKDAPKKPCCRISASVSLLSHASYGIFLFADKSKEHAFTAFKKQKAFSPSTPATIAYGMKHAVAITAFEE